ncbi:MAG: HslU--HslV peptidase ATPase subunit [Bacillota bacterium]|nr:MAG: HslU--HslV peptidase ATPase subunit [Bacillota bacterium]
MDQAAAPGAAWEPDRLTPRQIVAELDRYIVGQAAAKRAVAIALRNRWRRQQLPPHLRDEVAPKNILMIGPTGVGKTEIARRLARLTGAPFIKVEATKFTEVGYVGRDVESIIRDLVETAIRMVKAERMATVQDRARAAADERLLDVLVPPPRRRHPRFSSPWEMLLGPLGGTPQPSEPPRPEEEEDWRRRRQEVAARLRDGQLEDQVVEIEVEDQTPPMVDILGGPGLEEVTLNVQDLLKDWLPRRKRRRRLPVREAREVLAQEEAQKLIDMDQVVAEAIRRTEQAGIVFIDEIDKIAGRERGHGPDVSREGVQRDILPIVEGSTVMTRHGPVRTDHILFIAAGAFHVAKPSDLIPELQGRFPIRVELQPLTREDFKRILTEPDNALLRQYQALLATDGVELEFTPDAVDELAAMAARANEQAENIGARRLHTLLERVLEPLAFDAPDALQGKVVVDGAFVRQRLEGVLQDQDLSRYIL